VGNRRRRRRDKDPGWDGTISYVRSEPSSKAYDGTITRRRLYAPQKRYGRARAGSRIRSCYETQSPPGQREPKRRAGGALSGIIRARFTCPLCLRAKGGGERWDPVL
jgi:hypothetical protein